MSHIKNHFITRSCYNESYSCGRINLGIFVPDRVISECVTQPRCRERAVEVTWLDDIGAALSVKNVRTTNYH